MATINDVAALAGASIKSVSRVINNEPRVSDKLRAKVLEAIKSLDYRPSQAARGLAGVRSFLFAFVYCNPTGHFYPHYFGAIQEGAGRRCREIGCHLVVEALRDVDAEFPPVLARLANGLRIDGIILIPPTCDDPAILDAIARAGIPVARISPYDSSVDRAISMDEKSAASSIVRYLLDLGHRRIGMLREPPGHLAASQRYAGYVETLSEFGLTPDPSIILPGYFHLESAYTSTRKILTSPSPPTAIFAGNDVMAFGALRAAADLGISVPKDLSIVGFDDHPSSELIHPPLTTIRQPLEEMGIAAIDCLTSNTRSGILSGTLIIRDSTAAPARVSNIAVSANR